MIEILLGIAAIGGLIYVATKKDDASGGGGGAPDATLYKIKDDTGYQYIDPTSTSEKPFLDAFSLYREESSEMSPKAGAIAVNAVQPGVPSQKTLKVRSQEIESNNATEGDPIALIASKKDIAEIVSGKTPAKMTFFFVNKSKAPEFAAKGSDFVVITLSDG